MHLPVAENGAFGGLFSAPLPPHPNPLRLAPARQAPREPPPEPLLTVFDIHSHSPSPPPPFLRGTYFGSTSSVPKIDSSPSTLRIMARGIYRTMLPTGLHPRLPIHRHPLNSGVYSLFSRTHASRHERTTIATHSGPNPCPVRKH
jgi:hypothetical protein